MMIFFILIKKTGQNPGRSRLGVLVLAVLISVTCAAGFRSSG